MSTAIIKFENCPEKMFQCLHDSYPCGLGFDLLDMVNSDVDVEAQLLHNADRFLQVAEIPTDIQYEYIINTDNTIHCQECWFTSDINYHGGGFRHGGAYDLKEWKEKIRLQQQYAYRLPEYWK